MLKHKLERSDSSHAILDPESRKRKAAKIAALVGDHTDLSKAHLLDIGTGAGVIAHELSKVAATVHSVDVVDERTIKDGYTFRKVTDEELPFPDHTFDVVVSNHVVEHVSDQAKHFNEILRVLKPDGIIYLTTPNKYWIKDPHYKLLFVSWTPTRVSVAYVKLLHGKQHTWDIKPLSDRGIRRHLAGRASMHNALPTLIRSAGDKQLDGWQFVRVLRPLPNRILETTRYISPTLIYIVKR